MLKIAEIRKQKGITQKQLAAILHIYQSNLSNWETGVTEPDMQSLVKMADILEVTTDYLLGRENEVGVIELKNGLSKIENDLIAMFRKLDHDGQIKLYRLVEAYTSM